LLFGDQTADFTAAHFNWCGVAGDRYRLRDLPNLKIDIDSLVFVNVQFDVSQDRLLETAGSSRDRVDAGRQAGHVIEPVVIGGDGTTGAGFIFGESDVCFGDCGALRISHRAGDVAGSARLCLHADKQTDTQQE